MNEVGTDPNLNHFVDDLAEIWVQHGLKREIILPTEEEMIRKHLKYNIVSTMWDPELSGEGAAALYDSENKEIDLYVSYEMAVNPNIECTQKLRTATEILTLHEIGHSTQYVDCKPVHKGVFKNVLDFNGAADQFGEATNSVAEAMISCSYYNSLGKGRFKLELSDDITNITPQYLPHYLDHHLYYTWNNKNIRALSYGEYFGDLFLIMKTFNMSMADVVRSMTVLGGDTAGSMVEKYKSLGLKNFKGMIGSMGSTSFSSMLGDCEPCTLKDCKQFIKEINEV